MQPVKVSRSLAQAQAVCMHAQGPACTGGLPSSLTATFSNPFKSKAPRPPELQLFDDKPECPLQYDR